MGLVTPVTKCKSHRAVKTVRWLCWSDSTPGSFGLTHKDITTPTALLFIARCLFNFTALQT